jgi:uncharacterized protein YkwD
LRKFLSLLLFLFLLYVSLPIIETKTDNPEIQSAINTVRTSIDKVKENPEVTAVIEKLQTEFIQLTKQLNQAIDDSPQKQEEEESDPVAQPDLNTPDTQLFSVYNIEIGDKKETVEQKLGSPNRSTENEYGVKWHTYHEHYHNFIMIAYDEDNKVAGLYTNQDLISSPTGIQLGSSQEAARAELGEPLTAIRKGLISYQLQSNGEYDLFQLDNSYATIFYDKHQNNQVTAIQLITEELEQNKKHYYTESSQALKKGFEYQLFDLTNAARIQHGLGIVGWDEEVRVTARDHSKDMAVNNYFDHTNLEGQSPFERMQEDDILFSVAGENLAYGQVSSIFAHEGLMNSLGHRKNILKPEYEFLGVGLAFNEKSQPYFTENFFAQ